MLAMYTCPAPRAGAVCFSLCLSAWNNWPSICLMASVEGCKGNVDTTTCLLLQCIGMAAIFAPQNVTVLPNHACSFGGSSQYCKHFYGDACLCNHAALLPIKCCLRLDAGLRCHECACITGDSASEAVHHEEQELLLSKQHSVSDRCSARV